MSDRQVPPTFTGETLPLGRTATPPPFPVHAFTGPVRAMIAAAAEATQTDPGLVGPLVLGALATTAGGCVEVQVRQGWIEPLNLFVCPAASPGTRKSAVFRLAFDPVRDAERFLADAARPTIIAAATERDVALRAAEAATAKAGKATAEGHSAALADAIGAAETAEGMTVPALPRLLADDVTPEAMTSLLAEHGGRLSVASAEGGLFDVFAGRYSKLPNLDALLKGHAGDMLRVDRKGRPPEYVERPALTLALTVQPAVLESIGRNESFAGRGLLARVLFTLPPSTVGRRRIAAPPVPAPVQTAYGATIQALATELAGWSDDPAMLVLTPEASAVMLAAEHEHEPRLAPGGALSGIVEWASKSMGAAARIAGLLHLAEHGAAAGTRRPIEADTMRSALTLVDYFTAHALAVFDLMGSDRSLDDARAVLRHVRARGIGRATERDLFSALPRSRFPTADALREALAVLDEHGWATAEPVPERTGPGRKPSPAWLFRPEPIAAVSALSAEPHREPRSADYADCAATA